MSDYIEQIEQLLERSYSLDNNLTKVNILETAIKIADSHQDIDWGFELREDIIQTLYYCGYPEKLLVAFSWCLAQCDRNPERFPESQMLWTYKWVTERLPRFPQIPRQQIEDTFNDMQIRYLRCGKSLRAVYQHQLMAAISMGDFDLAPQYYQQWQDASKDFSNDCQGCELDEEVRYLLFMGKEKEALNKAKPIVSGRLRCDELPHATLSRLLIPLLKLNRLETAVEYHFKSCPKISKAGKFLEQLGEQILFLVLTNNAVKAISLIEKNMSIILFTAALGDRFYFYRAAYFLMSHLQEKCTTKISLLLPQEFSMYDKEGKYSVEDLTTWFESQAKNIAEQCDRRNDNNFYRQQLQQLTELKQYKVDYSLNLNSQIDRSVNLSYGNILETPND